MAEKQPGKNRLTVARALPYLLIIGSIIGLIASYILIYDQIKIWQNPHFTPACNLNPLVSCGTVINSKQGEVFGVPGPFFGLVGFAASATVGGALLAGARFKRWFWLGLQAGVTIGLAYMLWLFWLSLYRIHALCPFCLTVDVMIYTIFWYVTLYNVDQGHVKLPKGRPTTVYSWVRRHHLDLLVLWLVLVAAWILKHFWYYYGKSF